MNQLLQTTNAKATLKKLVSARTKTIGAGSYPIVNLADPVQLHSEWQFQYEKVEYDYDAGLDDLYGSLGAFALYAALLEGTVTGKQDAASQASLKVTRVGIYMRDTFEFIGAQYLGHWNDKGMAIVPAAAAAAKLSGTEWYLPAYSFDLGIVYPFNNSDFRAYRTKTKKGGDLMVFSDVLSIPVNFTVQL